MESLWQGSFHWKTVKFLHGGLTLKSTLIFFKIKNCFLLIEKETLGKISWFIKTAVLEVPPDIISFNSCL